MNTSTITTHAYTARLDIHEIVRQLNMHLGPTLVAALSGTKDWKMPIRWAKSDGPTPGATFNRRLQLAHRLWTSISALDGDDVARSWFIGGNPLLEDDTPVTAIREDRDRDVAAAEAFLNHQPTS